MLLFHKKSLTLTHSPLDILPKNIFSSQLSGFSGHCCATYHKAIYRSHTSCKVCACAESKILRVFGFKSDSSVDFLNYFSLSLLPSKAVLWEKLKAAQCSELVKSSVPSIWFLWKSKDFLVAQEQHLDAMGHRALLEHSPLPSFFAFLASFFFCWAFSRLHFGGKSF